MVEEKIIDEKNVEVRKKIQKDLLNFLSEIGITEKDHLLGSKYDIMLFEKSKV